MGTFEEDARAASNGFHEEDDRQARSTINALKQETKEASILRGISYEEEDEGNPRFLRQ